MREALSDWITPYMPWLVGWSFVLTCLVLPVLIAFRSQDFIQATTRTWMLWFGWHAYMSFIIGPGISRDPVLRELEVEGITLVPIIFLGWLPAGIFAWVSLSISSVLQRFFSGVTGDPVGGNFDPEEPGRFYELRSGRLFNVSQ